MKPSEQQKIDTHGHNGHNASTASNKPKSIIFENQLTHENDKTRFRVDIDKKQPSLPISVIVKCRQPEPRVVTESIFCKPVDAEKIRMSKTVTESLCSKGNAILPTPMPIPALVPSDDFMPNINGLKIESLHSGDQCIPLGITDSKKEESTIVSSDFDNMMCINFDEREESKLNQEKENFWCKKNALTSDTESIFSNAEASSSSAASSSVASSNTEINGTTLPFVYNDGGGKFKEKDLQD